MKAPGNAKGKMSRASVTMVFAAVGPVAELLYSSATSGRGSRPAERPEAPAGEKIVYSSSLYGRPGWSWQPMLVSRRSSEWREIMFLEEP